MKKGTSKKKEVEKEIETKCLALMERIEQMLLKKKKAA